MSRCTFKSLRVVSLLFGVQFGSVAYAHVAPERLGNLGPKKQNDRHNMPDGLLMTGGVKSYDNPVSNGQISQNFTGKQIDSSILVIMKHTSVTLLN
jgi:hypothetical protein